MNKTNKLTILVNTLYTQPVDHVNLQNFINLQHWHILKVLEYSKYIQIKLNEGDLDLIVAGALTHDIADSQVLRSSPDHEALCDLLQLQVMSEAGYTREEVVFVKNEITDLHGCKGVKPTTIEGQIVASADACAHLSTDFYLRIAWYHKSYNIAPDIESYKKWVLGKLERDYTNKIFFEWLRSEMHPYYESLKMIFSK